MIEPHDPADLSAIVPWIEDRVVCMPCGMKWIVERPVGSDYTKAKCPACGERNAELEAEAGWRARSLH